MTKRYGISAFPKPSPMPRTPAGKFLLLYDLTTPIVDAETGETYPPILTPEEGLRLLETPMPDDHMPLGEKIERFCEAVENPPPPTTLKVRRICYTGEGIEPDAFDNLLAEREAAVWAVSRTVAGPCRASLLRYIAAIDKILRSTSAKEKP